MILSKLINKPKKIRYIRLYRKVNYNYWYRKMKYDKLYWPILNEYFSRNKFVFSLSKKESLEILHRFIKNVDKINIINFDIQDANKKGRIIYGDAISINSNIGLARNFINTLFYNFNLACSYDYDNKINGIYSKKLEYVNKEKRLNDILVDLKLYLLIHNRNIPDISDAFDHKLDIENSKFIYIPYIFSLALGVNIKSFLNATKQGREHFNKFCDNIVGEKNRELIDQIILCTDTFCHLSLNHGKFDENMIEIITNSFNIFKEKILFVLYFRYNKFIEEISAKVDKENVNSKENLKLYKVLSKESIKVQNEYIAIKKIFKHNIEKIDNLEIISGFLKEDYMDIRIKHILEQNKSKFNLKYTVKTNKEIKFKTLLKSLGYKQEYKVWSNRKMLDRIDLKVFHIDNRKIRAKRFLSKFKRKVKQ